MIHAYESVNFTIVYDIAANDMPSMIATLEAALSNWPTDLT